MASISKHLVSKNGLHLWYNADESPVIDGTDILSLTDLSGNGRTGACLVNYPQYVSSVAAANNMPAIGFDSATSSPVTNSSSVVLNTMFVVASASGSTFGSQYRGLLGGPGAGDPLGLVGTLSSNLFFDAGNGQVYRKANTVYANNNMVGPMSGLPKVIEMQYTAGIGFALGIQIGKDRNFATRLWDHNVFEIMIYTRILNDYERARIYQYFARKYHLWETSGGYDVFPAVCDWNSQATYRKKALFDEAEDGTALSRVKVASKTFFDLNFNGRLPDELSAVKSFYDLKYPGTRFIYRDKTLYPSVDVNVRFDVDADVAHSPANHTGFSYKTKLREV